MIHQDYKGHWNKEASSITMNWTVFFLIYIFNVNLAYNIGSDIPDKLALPAYITLAITVEI